VEPEIIIPVEDIKIIPGDNKDNKGTEIKEENINPI
jgi:hypothetical protein